MTPVPRRFCARALERARLSLSVDNATRRKQVIRLVFLTLASSLTERMWSGVEVDQGPAYLIIPPPLQSTISHL